MAAEKWFCGAVADRLSQDPSCGIFVDQCSTDGDLGGIYVVVPLYGDCLEL